MAELLFSKEKVAGSSPVSRLTKVKLHKLKTPVREFLVCEKILGRPKIFFYLTASFSDLPALNLGTFLAAILMVAPV